MLTAGKVITLRRRPGWGYMACKSGMSGVWSTVRRVTEVPYALTGGSALLYGPSPFDPRVVTVMTR
jgi:hypothetical protein